MADSNPPALRGVVEALDREIGNWEFNDFKPPTSGQRTLLLTLGEMKALRSALSQPQPQPGAAGFPSPWTCCQCGTACSGEPAAYRTPTPVDPAPWCRECWHGERPRINEVEISFPPIENRKNMIERACAIEETCVSVGGMLSPAESALAAATARLAEVERERDDLRRRVRESDRHLLAEEERRKLTGDALYAEAQVATLTERLAKAERTLANLAACARMVLGYPKTREKQLAKLASYMTQEGLNGSILRASPDAAEGMGGAGEEHRG